MAAWRRLCIDVDDAGHVIGASIEHYGTTAIGPDVVSVWAGREWRGLAPPDLLEALLHADGHQEALDLGPEPFPSPR